MQTLTVPSVLAQSPYQHYVYSYPHKTTYRPLPARSLTDVWAIENRNSLFLYIHIPFCEMRCGFCNLFTTVSHDPEWINHYVQAVYRQAKSFRSSMGTMQFARFALGGGTPTQLPLDSLERILDIADHTMGASLNRIPVSVEVSPDTSSLEKLTLLYERGTDRISIGVQSFIDSEVRAIQRRQTSTEVKAALDRIRSVGFPTLNLDLIYGLPGQTIASWLESLHTALQFRPEEIYLYPLYVRPLTGLGCSDREWDDIRLSCYRAGRDTLLAAGYTQISMRMFRAPHAQDTPGPVYCCQADGMVGLGCGARSYTRSLHYSYDYAVHSREIKSILNQYIASDDLDFTTINYGFILNQDEQQCRFILLSLLSHEGLDRVAYQDRFSHDIMTDYPDLQSWCDLKLIQLTEQRLHLTELGLERSDVIGPSLFSNQVRSLMNSYKLK